VLRLERDRLCLTDSDGSLPDLEDASSPSDMGTCPYCFDRQHVSALECPLQGISEVMADQLNGMTYPERQGTYAYPNYSQYFINTPFVTLPALLIKWLESNSSNVILLPDQSLAALQCAFEDFVKRNQDDEEDKENMLPVDPHIAIDRTSALPSVFRDGNLSAAACVVPPTFAQHGRVVTWEAWSS
jgi:hypothetical protein